MTGLHPSFVVKTVADTFGKTVEQLNSQSRLAPIALVRQLGYLALQAACGFGTPRIARHFQRKDHTTVIHGLRVAHEALTKDADLAARFDAMLATLPGSPRRPLAFDEPKRRRITINLNPPKQVPAEVIDASKGKHGGWTRRQLAAWGLPYPPPQGWRRALVMGEPIPTNGNADRN